MWEKLLFWRKPKKVGPPVTVVRAAMTGTTGKRLHEGFLDMETFMADAGLAARAEGISDPDQIRKRKNLARYVLRNAREQCRRTNEPVTFTFRDKSFTVRPL